MSEKTGLEEIVLDESEDTALDAAWASLDGKAYVVESAASTRKLPQGRKMGKALREFFARQAASAIKQAKQLMESSSFVLAEDWDDDLAHEMRPYIEMYYDREAKAVKGRVGADEDFMAVENPKLQEAVDKAVFSFAKSTNETTSMELSDALDKLRDEMRQGLVQGDPVRELTKRVQGVFDNASKSRAMTIATTEASRATHHAQVLAGEESGVVRGWRWVLSEDACELCIAVAQANPEIPIGGTFATFGDHPDYSQVQYPPPSSRVRLRTRRDPR